MITSETLAAWNAPLENAFNDRVNRAAFLMGVSAAAASVQAAFASGTLEEWNSSTAYSEGTYVRHNDKLFRAIADSTDVEPAEATEVDSIVTQNSAWRLINR